MKSIEKLMDIDLIINSNGGINFLKIRAFFDDIDRLAGEGNSNAVQFSQQLDNIRVVKRAVENEI